MQDLNKLEERTLKLRRSETEKFKVNEISFDTLNEQPVNSGEIYEELMRLRAENNGFKNQIKQKEKDTDEKNKKLTTDPESELASENNSFWRKITVQHNEMEKTIHQLQRSLEISEGKKSMIKESLVKYIIRSEEQQKKVKRIWVKEQHFRMGRAIEVRFGSQFKTVWEDGEEFRDLHNKLEQLREEREKYEKIKKGLRAKRKQEATASGECSDDSIAKNDYDYQLKLDLKEEKEILSFKISLNQKATQQAQDELDSLKKEKMLFQVELNRIKDEESSKRNGIFKSQYEILNDRYLILSLLGRGGYSEIYKAYDLENWREVACKIHHFDNNWTESLKANYIKHALRENKTHRELNHPRVVRQYDTVEVDNNSFWTILELWNGPDLALYLKKNGVITEKEAKLIISQILSGLKYLNERERRIIHYDLKPQNILFHKGEIKISDFGLWKELERDKEKIELTSQGVGTYWYQPPEWFEVGPDPTMINSKVDVWSVGVIFYELLYGSRPFADKISQTQILQERIILKEAKTIHFPAKPSVSNDTKELIKSMWGYNIESRLSVEEAYFQLINNS
jgi:tousled-like kinase